MHYYMASSASGQYAGSISLNLGHYPEGKICLRPYLRPENSILSSATTTTGTCTQPPKGVYLLNVVKLKCDPVDRIMFNCAAWGWNRGQGYIACGREDGLFKVPKLETH